MHGSYKNHTDHARNIWNLRYIFYRYADNGRDVGRVTLPMKFTYHPLAICSTYYISHHSSHIPAITRLTHVPPILIHIIFRIGREHYHLLIPTSSIFLTCIFITVLIFYCFWVLLCVFCLVFCLVII